MFKVYLHVNDNNSLCSKCVNTLVAYPNNVMSALKEESDYRHELVYVFEEFDQE